jgi:hypothetical protein
LKSEAHENMTIKLEGQCVMRQACLDRWCSIARAEEQTIACGLRSRDHMRYSDEPCSCFGNAPVNRREQFNLTSPSNVRISLISPVGSPRIRCLSLNRLVFMSLSKRSSSPSFHRKSLRALSPAPLLFLPHITYKPTRLSRPTTFRIVTAKIR